MVTSRCAFGASPHGRCHDHRAGRVSCALVTWCPGVLLLCHCGATGQTWWWGLKGWTLGEHLTLCKPLVGVACWIYIFARHEEASLERSSSWTCISCQSEGSVWFSRGFFLKWDWIQRWNGKIPKSRWWTVLSWGDTHGLHPLIPKKHMPPADVLLHAGGAERDIFVDMADICWETCLPPSSS